MRKKRISTIVALIAIGHVLYAPSFKQELTEVVKRALVQARSEEEAVAQVASYIQPDLTGKQSSELNRRHGEYSRYIESLSLLTPERRVLEAAYKYCCGSVGPAVPFYMNLRNNVRGSHLVRDELGVAQQNVSLQGPVDPFVQQLVMQQFAFECLQAAIYFQHRQAYELECAQRLAQIEQQRALDDARWNEVIAGSRQEVLKTPERPRHSRASSYSGGDFNTPDRNRFVGNIEALFDEQV